MKNLQTRTYFAEDAKDIVIVELEGYIDQANCYEIEKIIDELISGGNYKLIIDASKILYMSSAGWGVLIGEVKGIREKGGDIRIAGMAPAVYEIFQMLEFYHILQEFNNIDDAVKSFKIEMDSFVQSSNEIFKEGYPIHDEKKENNGRETDEVKINNLVDEEVLNEKTVDNVTRDRSVIEIENNFDFLEPDVVDLKVLPIHEKIKRVIAKYPLISIFKIRKLLRHEDFGSEKIGVIKLYRILRRMNLHTPQNRYRYYRSC